MNKISPVQNSKSKFLTRIFKFINNSKICWKIACLFRGALKLDRAYKFWHVELEKSLILLFRVSIFNSCVINSCRLKIIFYYWGLIQLYRCLSVTHTRHTFIYFLHKKSRLMRSKTACYRYFQNIHFMIL